MPVTSYKPVYWGEEPTTSAKLNQMVNNTQWVYENMPRIQYSAYGVKKSNSVKMIAGTVVVPANGALWSSADVSFGNYFTPGCKPVVVTARQPTNGKWRFHHLVRGFSDNTPDHRGVRMAIGADYFGTTVKNVVDAPQVIHYLAIGW